MNAQTAPAASPAKADPATTPKPTTQTAQSKKATPSKHVQPKDAQHKLAPRKPPVDYIPRITAQYVGLGYGEYRWVHSDTPPPWAPLIKPISQSRIGLIATGGIYAVGQTAFHYRDDTTYRAIPTDVDTSQLRATHFAYDLTDARKDVNCVFPIDALRALRDCGEVGELGPNAYTIMGGIYSTRRVHEELIPALAKRCVADELDAVLLVPV